MEVNENFLEKCITKGLFNDKHFAILVTSAFKDHYFSNDIVSELISFSRHYINNYNELPTKDMFLNSLDDEFSYKASEYLDESLNVDVDLSTHYDWLIENTNDYLKDRSIKEAISKSVDIIEENKSTNYIRELVEEALTKDLKMNLGVDYFGHLKERLTRIFSNVEERVPSGFPTLDNYINGGFPAYTLSIIAAQIHGFKSNMLANIAARDVERGKNVAVISFEMSEDMYAQRIDGIFTKLDINRMYINTKLQKDLIEKLKGLKSKEDRGDLWIKEFPTGKSTVNDMRIYLRELSLRNFKPDVIICDYVNLIKPENESRGSYEDKKTVAEELRALSFEFDAPVISVTQINREGGFIPLKEIDHNYTAECLDPNSLVDRNNGTKVKIKDIQIGDYIKGSNGYVEVRDKFWKKKKKYKITTESGKEIICSKDHKFPTDQGKLSFEEGLEIGMYLKSKDNNDIGFDDFILEIEEIGEEDDMVDIEVSDDHLFYANDILTKNSLGIPATADFMMIFGEDKDSMIYQNELHYKIIKNRLGGMVGTVDKLYIDKKSLKMYDKEEIDLWFEEARTSGDSRKGADNG